MPPGAAVYSQHFLHLRDHYLDEYSCRALSPLAAAMVNITLHLKGSCYQKWYIYMHKINNNMVC